MTQPIEDIDQDLVARLSSFTRDVVLVGVRHHSPACARHVAAVIERIAPAAVLVEGPSDFEDFQALQDPELLAPIALFVHVAYATGDAESPDAPQLPAALQAQIQTAPNRRFSAWYPFCDYSPELVAIRTCGRLGIPVSFCDLTLHQRVGADEETRLQLSEGAADLFERFQGTATFQDALNKKLGAQDSDDAWDLLFELRHDAADIDHTSFAAAISAYGSAIRESTPLRRLDLRGDDLRERVMAAAADKARADAGGRPVLVVCGAAHLLGIDRWLARDDLHQFELPPVPDDAHEGVHLVPYDFARMVSLRYAAGMPAPAWYQAQWDRQGPDMPPWLVMLSAAAQQGRGWDLGVSTAEVSGAAEFVERLARFRGHPVPTRSDVMDGVRSCWVKGHMSSPARRVLAMVREAFAGKRAGRVGPLAGTPPLVADVQRVLAAHDLRPSAAGTNWRDAETVRLRPARAERDLARARVLIRLQYLDVDVGKQERGPKLLEGKDLDRVEQHWTLRWTTEAHSRLVECGAYGATLADAVAERFRERLAVAQPGSAGAVEALQQAYVLGLDTLLGPLLEVLGERLESDGSLRSVMRALHGLVVLSRYRDVLGAVGDPRLQPFVSQTWLRTTWLLDDLAHTSEDTEDDVVDGLRALEHATQTLGDIPEIDPEHLYALLLECRSRLVDAPGVHGAVDALLWGAGKVSNTDVGRAALSHFRETRDDPAAAGRYLAGVIAVKRRAYLDEEELIEAVSVGLAELDEQGFRMALPRMRRTHTALTPAETSRLADRLGSAYGFDAAAMTATLPLDSPSLLALERIDREVRDELDSWTLALPTSASAISDDMTEGGVPQDDVPEEGALDAEPAPWGAEERSIRLRRWRLILGRYSNRALPPPVGDDLTLEEVLGFLYDREYADAVREQRTAGSGGSTLEVPDWIGQLERLFPKQTYEKLEAEALERYGLEEMVTNSEVLERCEPSLPLLEAILRLKHKMNPAVLAAAKRIVKKVARDLEAALKKDIEVSLFGSRRTAPPRPWGPSRHFDPATTIRRNLRHWDPALGRIVVRQPWFRPPQNRSTSRWRVIVCVDQSGSMLRSMVHAGVMAAIFSAVPDLDVRLVVFDTQVVDLSEVAEDPVETLLSVQLGGGTDIARAVGYCEGLIDEPRRTMLVLITDLYEGGDPDMLVTRIHKLVESGVRTLILAALDDKAEPDYDRVLGRRVVRVGARVAAMTPHTLAQWIGEVLK